MRKVAHGAVQTSTDSLHWTLTLREQFLVMPGNWTCISVTPGILVWCSTNWAIPHTNSLSYQGTEPASVLHLAFWYDALPTELSHITIPCHTRELNLHQCYTWHFGMMLYQLTYKGTEPASVLHLAFWYDALPTELSHITIKTCRVLARLEWIRTEKCNFQFQLLHATVTLNRYMVH